MRAFRAVLFAAVCVTWAAVAHARLSAHDLPLPAILGAFGVTVSVAWLAGGRRRGVVPIGAGLLAVQGVLHLIFSEAGAGAGADAAGHHHQSTAADTDAGMLVAHLLAAALCALWLARGEAAFFRLARAIGALAFTPLRLLLTAVRLPEAPRPVAPSPRPVRPHSGVLLAHALTRRGPPPPRAPLATAPGAAV
jgi:hypothetical protein